MKVRVTAHWMAYLIAGAAESLVITTLAGGFGYAFFLAWHGSWWCLPWFFLTATLGMSLVISVNDTRMS